MNGKHHGGDPSKSNRLKTLLDIFSDGQKHSSITLEAELERRHGRTVAIGSCVADLRKSGYSMECEYSHTTENGARIYQYWWEAAVNKGVAA